MKTLAAATFALFALMLFVRPASTQSDFSAPDTSALKLQLQPKPAAAAAAAESKDLSAQFSDEAKRNQKSLGSCHTFASVAALEAAYYRKYKQTVRFSEADLYYRFKLQGNPTFEDYNKLMADFARGQNVDAEFEEGSWPSTELPFAIKGGVATSWNYDKFMRSYIPVGNQIRAADQKSIQNAQQNDDMNLLERGFFWIITGRTTPGEYFNKLNKPGQDQSLNELNAMSAGLADERGAYQEKLKGFRVQYRKFAEPSEADRDDAAKCAAQGTAAKNTIVDELSAGRPVAIGMELKGLLEWGDFHRLPSAKHAFTLIGYKDGGKTFQTRNSWNGKNPDVQQAQLCRVLEVATVLVPGEKASAGAWTKADVGSAQPDNKH
jgi:hypothetical protein